MGTNIEIITAPTNPENVSVINGLSLEQLLFMELQNILKRII